MDAKLFVTKELARLRDKRRIYQRVIDINSNYSPVMKVTAKVLLDKVEVQIEYLMDILNSYDFYTQTYKEKEDLFNEI